MMLNKYVWVPIPKALVVWLIVQMIMASKDVAFAMLKGDPLKSAVWTSLTGMMPPGTPSTPPPDAETQALIKELQQLATGAAPIANDDDTSISTVESVSSKGEVDAPPKEPACEGFGTNVSPVISPQPPPVPTPAKPRMELAKLGPDQEAAKKLLKLGGKGDRGGRAVVFVNNHMLEVGDTIGVTYKGKRYIWKLLAIEDGQPRWGLQSELVVLPSGK